MLTTDDKATSLARESRSGGVYRIYLTIQNEANVQPLMDLALSLGVLPLFCTEGKGGLIQASLPIKAEHQLIEIELECTGDQLKYIIPVLHRQTTLVAGSLHVVSCVDTSGFPNSQRQNETVTEQLLAANYKLIVVAPDLASTETMLAVTEGTGAGRVDTYYGCAFTAEVKRLNSTRDKCVKSELRCPGVDLLQAVNMIQSIPDIQVCAICLEENPTMPCQIRVTLPQPDLTSIQKATLTAGAEAYFYYPGEGRWTSGAGSEPYIGEVGTSSRSPLLMLQLTCTKPDRVPHIVTAIKSTHPFQTPVIDVFQMTLLM